MNVSANKFELAASAAVILMSLLSIVFTFGVVWRVEKKLDVSYKLFLLAILFFTVSEILGYLDLGMPNSIQLWVILAKFLFALFFLLGILTVRRLVREEDGEI